MGRRRLFFDIETSPNIGFFWRAGSKQFVDYNNIIRERAIICVCYKWEGEDNVSHLTWDSKQDDKRLLQKFLQVANHAEELVGHNGDKFDMRWIRGRCLYHGIEMFPKYTTIDTLKIARTMELNSYRLNYLGQFLGVGEKINTEFGMWKDIVLNKDKEALNKMVEYCKQDVKLLEKVFVKMKNHYNNKTHYGVVYKQDRGSCVECGSDELVRHKQRITPSGTKYIQYQCKTCGKYQQKIDK